MPTHRDHRSPRLISVRPLEREDLAQLQLKPAVVPLQKLRDSHHTIARLAASGLSTVEIARRTGRSQSGTAMLLNNPAMTELVARYRAEVHAAWRDSTDEYFELIYTNGLKAQRQISDQLDAADDDGAPQIPINRLLAIAADSADRVGYTKKTTNVNINIDFAAKLEAARRRIETARQIEAASDE